MEDSVADEKESKPESKDKKWSIHIYTLEYTGDEEKEKPPNAIPG